MDFKVLKAEDGRRILVQSKYDEFVASYKHGEWSNELAFDPFEIMDLPEVEDADEANLIVNLAKRALYRW